MIKKTFNINLAGRQFVIDDDAYTLSNNYLDAIEHLVRDPEERRELTSDIEDRMAELLTMKLEEQNATIVNIKMVEEVIARIGQPNDFIETDEEVIVRHSDSPEETVVVNEPVNPTPPPVLPPQRPVKKRLYRDPQNAVFGGVCSGIAVYLGIDPIWIRLIFVAIALGFFNFGSFGWMAFAYILLWIIIPPADTPVRRMEMYGQEPTLGNLAKTVTGDPAYGNGVPAGTATGTETFSRVLQNIGKGILIFLGVIGVPVFIVLGLAILLLLFVSIMLGAGYSFAPIEMMEELGPEPIWGILTGLGACIVLIIPTFLVVWYLFKTLNPSMKLSRTWEIILAVLWVLAFVFTAICVSVVGFMH